MTAENQPEELSNKGFLIFLVVVFGWSLIGNCLEYLIRKDNLRHMRAPVNEIKLSRYDCIGTGRSISRCEKTEISLEGFKGYYKLVDYAGRDGYVMGIEKGDTVDVYTRKWFQYPLTLGRYESIYILEKNGQIFYTFEDYRRKGIYWIVFGSMGLLVFIPLLYFEINTPRLLAEGKMR